MGDLTKQQAETLALVMKFLQTHGYDLETVKRAADGWWELSGRSSASPTATPKQE
jgi:hypothetical protein